MTVAFALAFIAVFVLVLVVGAALTEGYEARRESRRRNHVSYRK